MGPKQLQRQDFAPILRASEELLNPNFFYTDLNRAWNVFNRCDIRRLVDRAVSSATRTFQLFETQEGIAMEAIMHKMRHIKRNNGLKSPDLGHRSGFRWEGWFYRVMKNATHDIIPRFLFHHDRISLEDACLPISIEPNPEFKAIETEQNARCSQEKAWRKQFALHATNRDISPPRRLCYLLLNLPKEVERRHFEDATSILTKSAQTTWKTWNSYKNEMLLEWKKDNQRQLQTRRKLCWLIYASKDIDFNGFVNSSAFNIRRDTFRKTASRAVKDIETGVALHLIAHNGPTTFQTHRDLIIKGIKDIERGESKHRIQKLENWNRSPSRNTASLAAILFTAHGDARRWQTEMPIQAQNKITRLSDRLMRTLIAFQSKTVASETG